MPIDRFLSIIGVTLEFFGVVFLLLGTFRFIRSDLSLHLPATPYGGSSLDRLKRLARQRGHTVSGLILVFLALMVQTLPLVVAHEPWEVLGGYDGIALAVAICLGLIPVLVILRRHASICRRIERKAKRAVMKDRLARAFNQPRLDREQWSGVVESANAMLGITRSVGEPVEMFLRKVAQELEVKYPVGLKIEDERIKPPPLDSAKAAGAKR